MVLLVSILAAVGAPYYKKAAEKHRVSTAKKYLASVKNSLDRYSFGRDGFTNDWARLDLPEKYETDSNCVSPSADFTYCITVDLPCMAAPAVYTGVVTEELRSENDLQADPAAVCLRAIRNSAKTPYEIIKAQNTTTNLCVAPEGNEKAAQICAQN